MEKEKKGIFVFNNKDKSPWNTLEDSKATYGINRGFRRGSKICVCGVPSSGKTNTIFNILTRDPEHPFDKIWVLQFEGSEEYDSLYCDKIHKYEELPTSNEIDKTQKQLFIFEDLDEIPKQDKSILDRYMRFLSSHIGLSVILVVQNFCSLPISLRRKCDVFVISKTALNQALDYVREISKEDKLKLKEYMKDKGRFDFVSIDLCAVDKYRFNLDTIIDMSKIKIIAPEGYMKDNKKKVILESESEDDCP